MKLRVVYISTTIMLSLAFVPQVAIGVLIPHYYAELYENGVRVTDSNTLQVAFQKQQPNGFEKLFHVYKSVCEEGVCELETTPASYYRFKRMVPIVDFWDWSVSEIKKDKNCIGVINNYGTGIDLTKNLNCPGDQYSEEAYYSSYLQPILKTADYSYTLTELPVKEVDPGEDKTFKLDLKNGEVLSPEDNPSGFQQEATSQSFLSKIHLPLVALTALILIGIIVTICIIILKRRKMRKEIEHRDKPLDVIESNS